MKYLIICFLGLATIVQAQQTNTSSIISLASPGVRNQSPGKGLLSQYSFQPNFNVENLNGETQKVRHNSVWNFKLKFPIVLKPNLKILGGLNYQQESYVFEEASFDDSDLFFSRLNGATLNTTRFSLYLTKSLNEKFYLGVKADAMYSGDYGSLTENLSRFATYRGSVAVGYKRSENTEYGFGVAYSSNFRRTIVLPILYLNHTYNDKFGLELTIPVRMKARYNLSQKSLLLIGSEFNNRNYSINTSTRENNIFHFRRSAVSLNMAYQYNLNGWLWFEAKGGYNLGLRNRIDDTQTEEVFRVNQGNAPFFSVGIFLYPSR